MPHFSKVIKTAQGNRSFYFNKIHTASGINYHVSVIDQDRKVIIFHMIENNGKWIIKDCATCPDWILNIENVISINIENH